MERGDACGGIAMKFWSGFSGVYNSEAFGEFAAITFGMFGGGFLVFLVVKHYVDKMEIK